MKNLNVRIGQTLAMLSAALLLLVAYTSSSNISSNSAAVTRKQAIVTPIVATQVVPTTDPYFLTPLNIPLPTDTLELPHPTLPSGEPTDEPIPTSVPTGGIEPMMTATLIAVSTPLEPQSKIREDLAAIMNSDQKQIKYFVYMSE